MATETPWHDPEFEQLLTEKVGADWAERAEMKWGSAWSTPCAEELAGELGSGWTEDPARATDVLANLLVADTTTEDAAEEPSGTAEVDLTRYEWLNTFEEADSLESWFVGIGVPAEDATAIVNAENGAEPEPDGPADIDLSKYEWLHTLEEADSLESWLVRIGVPTEDANAIVTSEEPKQ
jgi:hypothetical protein